MAAGVQLSFNLFVNFGSLAFASVAPKAVNSPNTHAATFWSIAPFTLVGSS